MRWKIRWARSGAAIQTVDTDTGHLHCKEPIPKIRNKYAQKRNCANLHIHVSVSNLYTVFPRSLCLFCSRKYVADPGNIKIAHRHLNVKLRTKAAQFLEKEYINGIYVAMYCTNKAVSETTNR